MQMHCVGVYVAHTCRYMRLQRHTSMSAEQRQQQQQQRWRLKQQQSSKCKSRLSALKSPWALLSRFDSCNKSRCCLAQHPPRLKTVISPSALHAVLATYLAYAYLCAMWVCAATHVDGIVAASVSAAKVLFKWCIKYNLR